MKNFVDIMIASFVLSFLFLPYCEVSGCLFGVELRTCKVSISELNVLIEILKCS